MAASGQVRRGRSSEKRPFEQRPQDEIKQLEELVKEHPEVAAQVVERYTEHRFFTGPLPPPQALREYNEVLPEANLGERIVQMAEKEQAHRHQWENRLLGLLRRGQWMAFVLGLAGLAVGAVLLYRGEEVGGIASLLLSVGVIAGSLLFTRRSGGIERPSR